MGLSIENGNDKWIEPDWNDLIFLAKIIPRILHNINRVCLIFGEGVQYPVTDITDTRISTYSLGQLRQADFVVNSVRTTCEWIPCLFILS